MTVAREFETPTYLVHAVRCDGWWAVDCPGVDGAATHIRTLSQIDTVARDALARALGVPADSFDVVLGNVNFADAAVTDLIAKAHMERALAEAAAARAEEALRAAIAALSDLGLTVRDTGRVLHS
ncbi:MAG TPA: hypothetical protein VHC63_17250 [Acidimicrobiales bacterium]|nr:hypothetical protein [Acidimicrobiales bacterium]